MSKRSDLLESIASTIADYRQGEIPQPDADHVDKWISQFAAEVQQPLLQEVDHVLKNTYFTKERISQFFGHQIKNEKLTGTDPCGFWQATQFLRIQQQGHSQDELLALLSESLRAQCQIDIDSCGSNVGPFLYVDDVLFSGSRIGNDFSTWIKYDAPPKATVHILVIATHTLGEWQTLERLRTDAANAGKTIDFHCWRAASFENRKSYRDKSEVLWPAVLPEDASLENYLAQEQKFPFEPRNPGVKPEHDIFSSEEGRQLLEREFLLAGVWIRDLCQNPSSVMRPLGFSAFGLGFGSMIVTFRNCPNNCPLALWWGDPTAQASSPLSQWYPLLPRKTYGQGIDFNDIEF